MARRPDISSHRLAEVHHEMVTCRRGFREDGEFFKATDAWKELCDASDTWSIKLYWGRETEDYKRKAGVISLDGRVTLTADRRLWELAEQGQMFANFVFAHELGHIGLDHHSRGAVTKNFQLFSGPNGASNLPPTSEELEANYAAVSFMCGAALEDERWNPYELARRSFCDPYYVKRMARLIKLGPVQRELNLLRSPKPRVVL